MNIVIQNISYYYACMHTFKVSKNVSLSDRMTTKDNDNDKQPKTKTKRVYIKQNTQQVDIASTKCAINILSYHILEPNKINLLKI